MQFRLNDPSLLIYKEEMIDAAKKIKNRLNYTKEVYASKLKTLRVHLEKTEDETSGYLEKNLVRKETKIVIYINPNDGIDFIRFVMLHELYHLLYSASSPLVGTGYNESDKSYSVNSIIRFNSNGEIGSQLNEQIANLHAYETIMHERGIYEQPSQKFKEIQKFMEKPMLPIKKLIDSFQIAPKSSYKLEDGILTPEGQFIPNNLFLYGISTGSSEIFVRKYEELMGSYSWGRLNKLIDNFYTSYDIEIGKNILNELRIFEAKFKK